MTYIVNMDAISVMYGLPSLGLETQAPCRAPSLSNKRDQSTPIEHVYDLLTDTLTVCLLSCQ